MRGTRRRTSASVPARRIIPAYAGNTELLLRRHHWCRDHPRVCGEHLAMTSVACERTGSSPRMRGTRADRIDLIHAIGIIPAYAGNTQLRMPPTMICWDHPRVCGEHHTAMIARITPLGSSPRMRGTRVLSATGSRNAGIIPAYAGNTHYCCSVRVLAWDHPRVCGEHEFTDCTMAKYGGSSPRMRGTRLRPRRFAARFGIIPAYAGNTKRNQPPVSGAQDHPRVCGEHSMRQP